MEFSWVLKMYAFLKGLLSHKEDIKDSSRWLHRLLYKKQEVAIFGAGGVGKSTLLKYLSGEFRDVTDVPGDYEESIGVETQQIKGENAIAFAVPGQQSRRATFWRELKEKVENGKVRGLIIVSCFGYHDLGRLPLRAHPLFDPGSPAEFLPKFLDEKRTDEQVIRRELANCCRSRKKKNKLWVLELITKQDLWFDESDAVQSAYKPSMKDLILEGDTKLDEAGIHVETVFVSFRINPLTSIDGEVLKNSAPQYTTGIQADSLKRLDRAIEAIMNWK